MCMIQICLFFSHSCVLHQFYYQSSHKHSRGVEAEISPSLTIDIIFPCFQMKKLNTQRGEETFLKSHTPWVKELGPIAFISYSIRCFFQKLTSQINGESSLTWLPNAFSWDPSPDVEGGWVSLELHGQVFRLWNTLCPSAPASLQSHQLAKHNLSIKKHFKT